MRGNIRIVGALTLGVIIVVGVYLIKSKNETMSVTAAIVVPENETREYIPIKDTDENGINDWEEQFSKKIIAEAVTSQTTDKNYEIPTTVTGQFALRLFKNRTIAGLDKKLTEEEKNAIVDASMESIKYPVLNLNYIERDLTISNDSISSLHDYGNAISLIILSHSFEERDNELNILNEAIQGIRPDLSDLVPIKITYKQFVSELLSTPVPPQLIERHLRIINLIQAVYEDIGVFEFFKTDPLLTLTYMKEYIQDYENLNTSFFEMAEYLFSRGVRYEPDEPAGLLIDKFGLNI